MITARIIPKRVCHCSLAEWVAAAGEYLQSRSLSGRHVSTAFLAPVLGAMMKQVCWHSRRSKAYRGLPEARMAGATVEETAFEDVNMWQAPVSQKPPLMGTYGREGELLNTKASPREGKDRQKTPSPPYNVPHTPLGIRRAGCFLLLCISQTPEMHPRPFFGGFWHPQWSFARVLPHPQGHPQASARALADM